MVIIMYNNRRNDRVAKFPGLMMMALIAIILVAAFSALQLLEGLIG
jgi:hypothetical protein